MKSLKFVSALALMAGSLFFFSSCSKQKDAANTIPKEQLVGKWTTNLVTSQAQQVQIQLKNGGAIELDVQPYDGIPEFIGVWEVSGTKFTGRFPYNGVADVIKFDGIISSESSISGQLKINDPNTPQSGTFSMNKQ